MKRKNSIPITFNSLSRSKPTYRQACEGDFGKETIFKSIGIRFWETRSKDYKTALFIASVFPYNEEPCSENEFSAYIKISNPEELHVYFPALLKLHCLIYGWKYVNMYIGAELCYPSELWIYSHHMHKRYKSDLPQFDIKEAIKNFNSPWKTEKTIHQIVRQLFPDFKITMHFRDSWLENLELDIYIEDINVGIEYQGIQHYKPMKHWGGEEAFQKRRINDIRKKHLCELHGTALIEFSYMDDITEELVKERLSKYISGGP